MFQLKEEEIHEDENNLIDDYEGELMERFYNLVPEDIKNPCPVGDSFREFRDKMTKVNEKIYKKIIKPGVGAELDLERTTVSYDYAMFLEAAVDPFDSSVLNKKVGVINVREGIEPTPGCYLALASMRKGEEAVFWISNELMFGNLGLLFRICGKIRSLLNFHSTGCPPRVPPAADILFSAKILENESEAVGDEENEIDKSFGKVLKEAAKNNNLAIKQFKLCNFSKAISIYRKWIEKLETLRMKTDEEEGKQKQLLIKMYQNICVCYNKIEKPEKTCVMIRELEKLTPIGDNPKALYAKGKAHMMLNNFQKARRYFMIAKRLSPSYVGISNIFLELSRRERATLQYETEQEALANKFQSEALQIAEEIQIEDEEKRKTQKETLRHLDNFKGKFERKIEIFKNDEAVERLSVSTDISTDHHFKLADEMCQKHEIQLKGTQMTTGGKTFYYLKK
jgi:FK506-binding protein 6